ncbi:MAG TPA: DUF3105 domain-containing protein [Actinomycetota bacterium]|nr:DUF3105 domain-containing protein [Actinomycetota bacterium]
MAEKPTKRERKEEAKRRRLEEMKRRQRRARMRKLYTLGIVGAIITAIVAGVLISRASNENARKRAEKLAAEAGCEPPAQYPSEGSDHITPPSTVSYKTDPPTSGAHYAQAASPPAPGPTGVLASALPNEAQVHNLEHGHILIQYQQDALTESQIKSLTALVESDPGWIQLAPRENRDAKVAFTAWQVLQKCNEPNDKIAEAAAEFVKRFKNQAPESVAANPVFQSLPPAPQPDGEPDGEQTGSPTGSPAGTASPTASPTAS